MKRFLSSLMAMVLVVGAAAGPNPDIMDVPADAELMGIVSFGSGAWQTDMSGAVLAKVAKKLKEFPEMIIVAEGHTDSVGDEEMNVRLAMKRANQVRQMLIKSYGADGTRIHTRGIGERRPIGDNKTADGRAKNRRVELHLAKAGNQFKTRNLTMDDAGSGKANVGSDYPNPKNVMKDKGAGKTNTGENYPAPKKDKPDVGKL